MGVMQALKSTARGIGRLPRMIGDQFMEEPQSDVMDYPFLMDERMPADGMGTPPFVPPKPRLKEGVKRALPRMLDAAIAAGATPNIAGGGGTDVLRAMSAARGTLQDRDMLDYKIGRERMMDEERQQSEMERRRLDEARANAYMEAQAATAARQRRLMELDETPKNVTVPVGGAIVNPHTGEVVFQNKGEARPTIVPPGHSVMGPDGNTLYTAPAKETPTRPLVVSPGGVVLGPDNKTPVFTNPHRPRAESGPSVAQQRFDEAQKVGAIARRILNDTLQKGGSPADAVMNAQKFYANDPEVSAYRTDVIAQLQRIAISQNRVENPAGGRSSVLDSFRQQQTGGSPAPAQGPPAPPPPPPKPVITTNPPASARQAAPQAQGAAPQQQSGTVKTAYKPDQQVRLKDGRVVTIKTVYPDGTFDAY